MEAQLLSLNTSQDATRHHTSLFFQNEGQSEHQEMIQNASEQVRASPTVSPFAFFHTISPPSFIPIRHFT
jgi:hypothetical protein